MTSLGRGPRTRISPAVETQTDTHREHRLSLPLFFLAAYVLTWCCWIPIGLADRGVIQLPLPTLVLYILGGLGPMLAAILISASEGGWQKVRSLFGQLKRWRVGWKWYAVAILGMFLLDLAPVPVHLALGGSVPIGESLVQLLVTPFIFIFTATIGGGLDEEMGWRGYALPRMQQRFQPLPANLMLGLIWSCWHLPLWFIPGSTHAASSFAIYLVTVTASSLLLGWIYNSTGGSLLIVVLAHAASNVSDTLRYVAVGTPEDAPHALTLQIVLAITTVAAAAFLIAATRSRLGQSTGASSADAVGSRQAAVAGAGYPPHDPHPSHPVQRATDLVAPVNLDT